MSWHASCRFDGGAKTIPWLALFWAASKQQEAIGLCQLGGERDKQENEMIASSRERS